MLFSRKKAIFGLFLTLLVASLPISNGNITKNELSQVKNELMKMNIPGVKPLFKLFPMPLAGIFGGNLLSIKTVHSFFKDSENSPVSVSKLVKINEAFAKLQNRVAKDSKDVAEKLIPHNVKSSSYSPFSNMKQILNYVLVVYSEYIVYILGNKGPKSDERIINRLIDHGSTERNNLLAIDSWSNRYPGSKELFNSEKWFLDHVMEEYRDLKENDDDCDTESLHTRIFKAWVHLTNVLTKGYAVVAAAHAVKLRNIFNDMPSNEKSQLKELQPKWENAVEEFRIQMGVITMDAKLKLDVSPREIRNCGSFNLVKGKTFERLNFIQNRLIFHKTIFMEPCKENDVGEPSLNNSMFFMFNCKDYNKEIIHLYMDRNDTERPLHQLDRINGSVVETMGRVGNKSLFKKIIDKHNFCKFDICQAYQREGLKYSTQFVQAQQDYVVTGIRWKIKKGVIYIEIQEGRFIDATQVDESTVHWKETPENDKEVKFLDRDLRSIALTDIDLPEKNYVKGVSLKDVNGIITMVITGQGTDDTGIKLLDGTSMIYENTQLQNMTELNLEELDDPEMAPAEAKNLVMRKQNQYFVKFQPTDLKKDFGRTTIPYFDIREVVTTPSAPISGLGIYHEAVPGYGGFLGLKMFSPNCSYMINTDKFDSYLNFHKKKVILP